MADEQSRVSNCAVSFSCGNVAGHRWKNYGWAVATEVGQPDLLSNFGL